MNLPPLGYEEGDDRPDQFSRHRGECAACLLGAAVSGASLSWLSAIRREVVGQVLAYAGGLWRMPYDDFATRYADRAGVSIVEHLRSMTGEAVDDEDALRAAVHAGLQSGRFRLVIAVDEITDELKLVVEYLNGHTPPEVQVLALEVAYVKDGEVEVLVPRLYGESSAKTANTSVKKLTVAEVIAAIDALDKVSAEAIHKLLAHARSNGGQLVRGTAGMSCWYAIDGKACSTWVVYPFQPKPVVSASVGSIHKVSSDRALRWVEAMRRHPALAPAMVDIGPTSMNRWPSIPVATVLARSGVTEAFLAALDEALLTDVVSLPAASVPESPVPTSA